MTNEDKVLNSLIRKISLGVLVFCLLAVAAIRGCRKSSPQQPSADKQSIPASAGKSADDYNSQYGIDGENLVVYRRVDIGVDERAVQIPELDWKEKRSDWINVKTDVTPVAIGDGIADDTTAIQNALDMIGPDHGAKKTVYLPPRSLSHYENTYTVNT
jgi:hypothetical protein